MAPAAPPASGANATPADKPRGFVRMSSGQFFSTDNGLPIAPAAATDAAGQSRPSK
jgi:hypothetical protein